MRTSGAVAPAPRSWTNRPMNCSSLASSMVGVAAICVLLLGGWMARGCSAAVEAPSIGRHSVRAGCEHVFVPYVELHAHSAFSFLDGASSPDELAAAAAALGYKAMALTDHNGVSGSMEFALAAEPLGLRAVHGVEIDVLDEGRGEGGAAGPLGGGPSGGAGPPGRGHAGGAAGPLGAD